MKHQGRRAEMVALRVLAALCALWLAVGVARAQDENSIDASDQPLVNGSITVAEVNAAQDGWVNAHLDENGSPGRVLGYTAVKAGRNTDVVIQLSEDIAVGTKLWPMLHVDAGTVGTYEFPGPDAPVVVNDDIVMTQITVTAGGSAPTGMPAAGGADAPAALLAWALLLLAAGVLLRRSQMRR